MFCSTHLKLDVLWVIIHRTYTYLISTILYKFLQINLTFFNLYDDRDQSNKKPEMSSADENEADVQWMGLRICKCSESYIVTL